MPQKPNTTPTPSISLATLPDATAQEVFDHVANHLLTQGKKSREPLDKHEDSPTCVYRTSDGLSCAAGCLMTDDEYNPEMERNDWEMLVHGAMVPKAHMHLIARLQRVHDTIDVCHWREALRVEAAYADLEWRFD